MTTIHSFIGFLKTYFTGFVAAVISTVFAGYMLKNGQVNADKIDAVVRHNPVVNPLNGRLHTGSVPKQWLPSEVLPLSSDQIITGSVPSVGTKSPGRSKKQDMRKVNKPRPRDNVAQYTLKIATKKIALIEGRGRLWSVRPGDLLPGSGRIQSIEFKRKKWIVVTTFGKIE